MLAHILLQAPSSGAGYSQLILIGVMVVVFYFFMIRPQNKKAKEQKKFKEGIQKGDHVVTIGGVHGTVVSIDGDTITLDVDRGVKIVHEKSAISPEMSKKEAVVKV